ncbi:alanyl-tRNA editing protein [Arhodomonas sp. SL1]|uniref:alanyl-tRNA editing protein n=1 Tax=Arhodomonas sp. SL1 TaxID=3425691 RepID=UPI003F880B2A
MSAIVPTERLFETDAYATEGEAKVVAVTAGGVILDRTLFYAESGGQPGDTGRITAADGRRWRVTDTRYLPGRLRIIHELDEEGPELEPGDSVTLAIDPARRRRHMRMHTALHVLCGLVPAAVTGCAIHAGRGRIDFDLGERTLDREWLDERLNAVIAAGHPVRQEYRDGARDSARTLRRPPGNGDAVRVVSIEGIDSQPCGGTHVASTAELDGIRVARVRKKNRRARRVELVDDAAEAG